jgi:hypothetical protein
MTTRVRKADGSLTEAGFQLQVVSLAKRGGWRIYHAPDNRPGRRTGKPQTVVGDTAGFPDLLLIRGSTLLVVELKTDTGRLRPGQQDWLDAFVQVGAESYLWRPRDIEDVQARLAPVGARGGLE